MVTHIPDSLERLTQADLIGVVRDLIGEVGRLRAGNEKLSGALTKLKAEHQAIKDELARLKKLPPRPPQKPSGMDKATNRGGAKSPEGEKSSRRRGSQLDKLTIGATVVVRAKAPAGSRHKGYEDIVVQDLNLSPQVTLYRRERWETPEGERIIAELDPGIVGGYGPHLHRFVLALHFSGQVTCERIVALLTGMGVVISKRQVVRLLTAKLETFRVEDEAVLEAGLGGAYVTVDDTGARHAGKSGYTTQIGSGAFTVFRTGPSKSRQAFLSRLCGGTALYVINEAALGYMKDRQLPQAVIDKFADHQEHIFSHLTDWERHLQTLGTLWIVYAAYRVVTGLIGMFFVRAMMYRRWNGGFPFGHNGFMFGPPWMHLMPVIAAFTVLGAIFAVIVGYSLLTRRTWGRILAIVANRSSERDQMIGCQVKKSAAATA